MEEATGSSTIETTSLAAEITKSVAGMMDQKLSELSSKLDNISAKFEENSQRITVAESHIASAEDNIAGMETRLCDTESRLIALTHRVVDEESRARRDNLKLFGVKLRELRERTLWPSLRCGCQKFLVLSQMKAGFAWAGAIGVSLSQDGMSPAPL